MESKSFPVPAERIERAIIVFRWCCEEVQFLRSQFVTIKRGRQGCRPLKRLIFF